MRTAPRKNALIVNAYFGERRRSAKEARTILRAVGPQYLAAHLPPERWRIRLHDEQTQGALADVDAVGSVDLLVVTGLSSAFDRMAHLAAFAKTKNPRAVVVAGGAAVRAAPALAAKRFDYALDGDVETVRDAIADAFGRDATRDDGPPRFDLAPWTRRAIYAESSRSCNFRCGFCSITAEDRPFARYDAAAFRAQILAQPRRGNLVLVDNNWFGPDRDGFDATLDVLEEFRAEGRFRRFGALVTADFFRDPSRVARAKAAGCAALFCGVESFDPTTLRVWGKHQNVATPPADAIQACLRSGIFPIYGLLLDIVHKSAAALRLELAESIGRRDGILPAFVVAPIPYPKTPFFDACVAERRLLPNVRLRDLNGSTLCVRGPDDPLETAALLRDACRLRSLRSAALRATARACASSALDLLQRAAMTRRNFGLLFGNDRAGPERTHLATTEIEDALYRPSCEVAAPYRDHFKPTYLTDDRGDPTADFHSRALRAPTPPPRAAVSDSVAL